MRFSFAIVFFAFIALFCGVLLPVKADRLGSRMHAMHQTTTTKAPTTPTTTTTTTPTTTSTSTSTTTTTTTTTLPVYVTDLVPTKAHARNCMCHEKAPTPVGDSLEVKDTKYFKYGPVEIRFSNPFPEQEWTCRQGGDDTWVGRSTTEISHTNNNDCTDVSHRLCSTIARWVPSSSCSDQTSKYVEAPAAGTNPSFVVNCAGTLYFGIWDSDSVCSTNSNNSIYFQTHLTYRIK